MSTLKVVMPLDLFPVPYPQTEHQAQIIASIFLVMWSFSLASVLARIEWKREAALIVTTMKYAFRALFRALDEFR